MDWSCPIHFNVLAIRLASFWVGGPPWLLTLYNLLLISSWKSNFKFSGKFRVGGKSWSSSDVILSWESRRSWGILQKIYILEEMLQNDFLKLIFYLPWFWGTFCHRNIIRSIFFDILNGCTRKPLFMHCFVCFIHINLWETARKNESFIKNLVKMQIIP